DSAAQSQEPPPAVDAPTADANAAPPADAQSTEVPSGNVNSSPVNASPPPVLARPSAAERAPAVGDAGLHLPAPGGIAVALLAIFLASRPTRGVARLFRKQPRRVLVDLPESSWDTTVPFWTEERLAGIGVDGHPDDRMPQGADDLFEDDVRHAGAR